MPGITELMIVLALVLVLFGTTKLKSLGSDLGSAIKGFRTAVSDEKTVDSDVDESADLSIAEEAKDTKGNG
jgi:sec-independent protein translocase protein TatA